MTQETLIKQSITKELKLAGWFVQSNIQSGFGVVRGRPDMECYKDGRVLLIEVKTDKGKQSPAQIEYQKKVNRYAPYILARSIEDIRPYLTETLF